MGTILAFPADREPLPREGAGTDGPASPAEIVIFPGVRIERHASTDEPPSRTVGGGRGRRARKTS
jgi:hypothetical protein